MIDIFLDRLALPPRFFVVMVGLPGSGKSTVAKEFLQDAFILSTDTFIENWSQDKNLTYNQGFPLFIDEATKHLWKNLKFFLGDNQNVIVDQTNLSAKKRKSLLVQVPSNYIKIACVVETDNTIRQERLRTRPGKIIPEDVDARMIASFQYPTKDEGFNLIISQET